MHWVIVPAFNEAQVIGTTLNELKKSFENIVVVDDCSSDDSGAIALRAGAHVVRHPVNLGAGAAMATGIAYALAQGADAMVNFDADGQHSVADAKAMLALLEEKGVDVVSGSRFLGRTIGMPFGRLVLLKLAIVFTRLTTGLKVTDAHNGLRALSRHAAQTIRIRQNRMAHASELLDEIVRHKLAYIEMPCTVTYSDYSKAKGQRWTGAFTILGDLLARKLYR